ncbi:amino acid permease [Paenibacillus cremeus]|uniref:amino acid permease n=1 Tax=Paenibacillus cremeus TaxID=2163881 RepID=UPI001C974F8D|nr:amino acid permease [Paenibacillus cremeus]
MWKVKQRYRRIRFDLTETEGKESSHSHSLSVGGLILIGIGGIIGAGFFLGCGLPIRTAGPGVLIAFMLGGLITAQVTGALTSIAVAHPVRGGFQVFPQMYLGSFAGYLQGWTYYLASILTISSEAVAMAIFTQLWLPRVPTLLLSGCYALLIIAINAFGVNSFKRIESVMSVVKIGAIVGFIVYAVLMLFADFGQSHGSGLSFYHSGGKGSFLPHGWGGVLQSMLIVLFSYAGIGVFAAAAPETGRPRDIETAAIWTLSLLSCLYLVSITLLLWLVPWKSISTSESPFVMVFQANGLHWLSVVLNGIILIAAFSVMAGALYSANQIIVALGQNRQAPKQVATLSQTGTPWVSLLVSTVLIAIFLVCSTVLPANVYNFLISASSYLTILNYIFILWTFVKWRQKTTEDDQFISKLTFGQPVSTYVTMLALVGLGLFALAQQDQRMGFYVAVLLGLLLTVVYFLWVRKAH